MTIPHPYYMYMYYDSLSLFLSLSLLSPSLSLPSLITLPSFLSPCLPPSSGVKSMSL